MPSEHCRVGRGRRPRRPSRSSDADIATGKCRLQCIEASDFIRPFTGSRLTTCPHRVVTNTMSTIYEPSRIPLRLDLRSDEARPSVEWGKVGRVIFTAPGAPLNQSALGPHRCHRIRSPWPCCFWSQTSRARLRVARGDTHTTRHSNMKS